MQQTAKERKTEKREILLDSNPFEKRLAINEGGKLVEFYSERTTDRGITGNIYKGTVVSVLPGMQAAFLEVGLDRTAFLHASDISESPDYFRGLDEAPREEKRGSREGPRESPRIQDLIKKGQEMMVQVAKEPIGTKGARVTSYVSLPGRYLVLMPTFDRVGVSRRIDDDNERRRLKSIVNSVRPRGYGFIIRTVCEGMDAEEIKQDMDYLVKLWEKTLSRMKSKRAPAVLYEEPDLTIRTIRDVFSSDVSRMIIEPREEYERAAAFIDEFLPDLGDRVRPFEGKETLFDSFGIEVELTEALQKKVWLPSGGSLVIDQMEALTAIDVNTGKFVGKKNSEMTVLKTNLEAVDAVVHQLRLRNIGGIIVIDFIDMAIHENRDKVYRSLKTALRVDKARTNILKISELGIVEMTRKRFRESLSQTLLEPCPYCDGNGLVMGKDAVVMEIYRDLVRELPKKRRKALLYVNPTIAERLRADGNVLDELRKSFNKKVVLKPVDVFHQEEYEIL